MSDVLIRPIRPDDDAAANEIRRQPEVMKYTLAFPSERVTENKKYFESLGPNDHVFAAEIEGRVVGIAGLHVKTGKLRHTGAVGIMVHDDFQGRGIGRALFAALMDVADNYLNLVRVELDVAVDNVRAIPLYESFGFEVEGRKRKAYIRDGEYVDMLSMARVR